MAKEPKYDQAFFLALAAKGKDEWNKWRRDPANGGIFVTFAGVDFSEAPRDQIDFSGFEFWYRADFSACKWPGVDIHSIFKSLDFRKNEEAFAPGRAFFVGADLGEKARFDGATFGDKASFTGVTFGKQASYGRATFGDKASFTGATFGEGASFDEAAFGSLASLDSVTLGEEASFTSATFGPAADFTGATFGKGASFHGAAFGTWAIFNFTRFKGDVQFAGKSIEQTSKDFELKLDQSDEKVKEARIALKKRHEDSWKRWGSGPDRFLEIFFNLSRFDGHANFTGRSFASDAGFFNGRFYKPPDFDAVASAARIDFTGASIGFVRPGRLLHWTLNSKVPDRLRRLRKLAEDTKNHDLERDLYIEERKAERGVYLIQRFEDWVKDPKKKWQLFAHLLWIIVMGIYWALADYGRSFVRPTVWLIASVFFFDWRYRNVLAPLTPKVCPLGDQYERAVDMLALGNAVPFVGPLTIDTKIKEFLFCAGEVAGKCPPIPPEGFQLLVIFQNLFSITCVFFIGLALRNYFRIK